jgi:hypothetical protein
MQETRIADVIATTTFRRVSEPADAVLLTLYIGRPELDDDQLDWVCQHQITGVAGEDEVLAAYGVDSLQALCSTITMARSRLLAIEHHLGVSLVGWDGLGIGLPESPSSDS